MNSKNIVLNGKFVDLSNPIVMAIVNITPDSFYSGNRCLDEKLFLSATEKALQEGATIIDIGAYSTRPGAPIVTETEELERISGALKSIRKHFGNIPISVDTFRSAVATCAVQEFDIAVINDVSGGELDEEMFNTVAKLNVPYILMHMRGTPQTMQKNNNTQYNNFLPEVLQYFAQKIELLRALNFTKEIIIDPGFGFAKTIEQNYELLRNLSIFDTFNMPILVGVSRKSMIYKLLNSSPEESLSATAAVNMLALEQGAHILRVHDVKAAMEVIALYKAYKGN
ncbi:MAG TPA: dihydropteroate synthase [Paludibacteraceae bacterium]|jgi:dihydropteroate synthase|nr:dihydropteroate synthase [Paludibacteraceae bacterium]HRS67963.1 dihydropteroate synthase [Paludibacteraceae bacterium]